MVHLAASEKLASQRWPRKSTIAAAWQLAATLLEVRGKRRVSVVLGYRYLALDGRSCMWSGGHALDAVDICPSFKTLSTPRDGGRPKISYK
jgi:hypothetical protein